MIRTLEENRLLKRKIQYYADKRYICPKCQIKDVKIKNRSLTFEDVVKGMSILATIDTFNHMERK